MGVRAPAARWLLCKRPAGIPLLPSLSGLFLPVPTPWPAGIDLPPLPRFSAPLLSPPTDTRARPRAVLAPTRQPCSPARPPARPPATVQWSLVESLLTSRHSLHGVAAEGRERDESEGGERECETERESWRGVERKLPVTANRFRRPSRPRGLPRNLAPSGALQSPQAGFRALAVQPAPAWLEISPGSGGTRRQQLSPGSW